VGRTVHVQYVVLGAKNQLIGVQSQETFSMFLYKAPPLAPAILPITTIDQTECSASRTMITANGSFASLWSLTRLPVYPDDRTGRHVSKVPTRSLKPTERCLG